MGWMNSDPNMDAQNKKRELERAEKRAEEGLRKVREEEGKRDEERRRKSSWN